jgi:hypothetical protein
MAATTEEPQATVGRLMKAIVEERVCQQRPDPRVSAFAKAPASKFSHGSFWFRRMAITIPWLVSSSFAAISGSQRAPLSMLAEDTNGSRARITLTSHTFGKVAISWAVAPDQPSAYHYSNNCSMPRRG